MKVKSLTVILLLLVMVNAGCNPMNEDKNIELTISAAASMTDVMKEIGQAFEEYHPGVKLHFNFASSGILENQIEQGAPVDIFISAGKKEMDRLVQNGLIKKDYSKNLLTNSLVLIVPQNNPLQMNSIHDLQHMNVNKLSIGEVSTVPAGYYAFQSFDRLGIWDELKDKIVFAKDVRQVLTYVQSGNVDAGIVYKSDYVLSKQVEMIEEIESSLHQPVIYPIGIVHATTHPQEAEQFYNFLGSELSAQLFEKYGFSPF